MKIEKLEIRNKRGRLALVVSIGTLLFCQMIAMVPLIQASSTLEITDWWVTPEPSKTYEDMIMQIQIHNEDSIDHTYSLKLSTLDLYKYHGGDIFIADGTIKAGGYVVVSIVLTPTNDGRAELELTLTSENPSPPPNYVVVDSETKWVTIEKGELETTADDLKSQISVLQSQIDGLDNKLNNLQTNMGKLQKENSELKARNEELSSQLSELQQIYDSLESDYKTLRKDFDSLQKASITFPFQWSTLIFIVITLLLAITTIYFATRKH